MNNTNQQLFMIYGNIRSFYRYRKMISLDDELSQDAFIKMLQKDKYMLLSAVSKSFVEEDGEVNSAKLQSIKELINSYNEKSKIMNVKIMNILLIYTGTDCESKRAHMMKLINHIRFPQSEVIIITPTKISSGVAKGLQALSQRAEHSGHTFSAFTYTLLNSVLPEHELVPTYEILTPEQVEDLKSWFIDPDSLPKIFDTDPQMVWIGATAGQIVKFVCLSEVTIESIGYCKVINA